MPNLRPWLGLMFLCVSSTGLAAETQTKPVPVKAPEQPSALLLEFVGDWETDERQLIGMETKVEKPKPQQNSKEVRRAH